MIRVFQADDHAIVRSGMKWLISGEEDMELVGESADGEAAIAEILRTQPDVVLLDLQMPKKTGLEVIPIIKAQLPNIKILVITSFGDDAHVFPAIQMGAMGYLLKDTAPNDILEAIRELYHGRAAIHPSIAIRVLQEVNKPRINDNKPLTEDPLSQREMEIVKLVATGQTNQEIADYLVVSERTVRTHVSNILSKLHLANRTQAALYALREGIASLDDMPLYAETK